MRDREGMGWVEAVDANENEEKEKENIVLALGKEILRKNGKAAKIWDKYIKYAL